MLQLWGYKYVQIAPNTLISFKAIGVVRDIIRNMRDDVTIPIPCIGDYHLAGMQHDKWMVATIRSGAPSEIICTIGIALELDSSACLWREMHRWGKMSDLEALINKLSACLYPIRVKINTQTGMIIAK